MAAKCPGERKSRTSLTLNQKLEMIRLSEQGLSKAEIGRQLGLLRQTVSQVVNAKDKFLRERARATPLHTRMIRRRNGLVADMEKALLAWIADRARRDAPPSQSLIQSQALALFNAMKAERGAGTAAEKFEASRGWFKRFKERSRFPDVTARGGGAATEEELLLAGERGKWLLEADAAPAGGPVPRGEMATKDLAYYVGLVDQAAAGFERMDANFERSSAVGKMLSHSVACYREMLRERKRRSQQQASPLAHFRKWLRPPPALAAAAPLSPQPQPSTSKQGPPLAKRPRPAAGPEDG